ncbi:MAG: DUF1801 domain-containing protein [Candidatus Limnocylindrales bacterium]
MTISAEALLAGYPEPMIEIAEELRQLVRSTVPAALEAVRPGWRIIGYDLPLGRKTSFFAWIMTEPHHVHLGFPRGVLLDDPQGELGGLGETKRARWLTVVAGQPVAMPVFSRFLLEAARVAGFTPSEQGAILADRELRSPSIDTSLRNRNLVDG